MESAKCIGRVRGLAVILGISAAITIAPGVAWAEPTGSDGGKDPKSTSQQDSSTADTRSKPETSGTASKPRTKGPLSRITDRVRKSVQDSANSVRNRTKVSATRTFGKKAQVWDKPAKPDAAPVEEVATAPDGTAPGSGPFRAVRTTSEHTATNVPTRRDTRNDEPSYVRPEPVTTLPEPSSSKRVRTVVVRVAEAAESVPLRGADSVSAVPATVPSAPPRAVDLPAAAAATFVQSVATGPEAEPAMPGVTKLVSGFLAAVGLSPLAGSGPATPAQSPALWALLAWTRRESERTVDPAGATTLLAAGASPAATAVVDPNQLTPQPDAPVVGDTQSTGWITGGTITDQWYMGGTDLGITWDGGDGYVLTIFGDTFDDAAMTTGWRSNVLLRSDDTDLSNGMQFDDAVISPGGVYAANKWWNPTTGEFVPPDDRAGAAQVIRDPGFLCLFGSTATIIPTAAVEVDGVQYVNVMSVRTWDTPGRWTTNWSAIAYSEDGGTTWTVDPNTVRSSGWLRSSTPYVPGNQNFQQGAFVEAPEPDPDTGINYVYSYGTPSGRGGSAYLARVPEDQIRNLDAYEYWAGEERGWVADDPSVAVPVIGATDQSPPPCGFIGLLTKAINDFLGGIVVGGLVGGNVSEMSVQYNEYLDQYIVLYTDGGNNVVMRVSDSPQGEWSEPTVLVANEPLSGNTGMYAPMIHPWSGTSKLGEGNENILYYNVSYWDAYNVQMMQTDLSPMGPDAGTAGTIAV